jgi:hypothetical protein
MHEDKQPMNGAATSTDDMSSKLCQMVTSCATNAGGEMGTTWCPGVLRWPPAYAAQVKICNEVYENTIMTKREEKLEGLVYSQRNVCFIFFFCFLVNMILEIESVFPYYLNKLREENRATRPVNLA